MYFCYPEGTVKVKTTHSVTSEDEAMEIDGLFPLWLVLIRLN